MGSEGTSGMVTDDSETFRLDNFESEVSGGAYNIVLLPSSLATCKGLGITLSFKV